MSDSQQIDTPQPASRLRSVLKFVLKLAITSVALYFVFTKIEFKETFKAISNSKWFYLLIALIVYNLSKVISTLRIKFFLQTLSLYIDHIHNVKLFYVGAFYNLFLPGSISGDGYKAYLLKKYFNIQLRKMLSVVVVDRISGLVALVVLACLLLLLIPITQYWPIPVIVLLIAYPAYFVVLKLLFKDFISKFHQTNIVSLIVQALQLCCAWFILKSLFIEDYRLEYLAVFMLASLVAVIPFTIGGLGARELVFLFGANYLHIDKASAIAFALLFFTITACSAMIGLFLSFSIDKQKMQTTTL